MSLPREVVHAWVESLRDAKRPKAAAGGEIHALLIGIDDYFPNHLPDGSRYPSLQGATRDVMRMADFLRERAGLKQENTRLLLSRAGEDGGPAEPPDRRPTYANLVAAFKRLATEAAPGDRAYIHYAGDGTRMPTEYPESKGRSGRDAALVPCDIGDHDSRYLRDLEVAALLRLLVDRGLLVTVVFDCCHAEGVMRGGGRMEPEPRCVPWIPRAPVPSAVAQRDLLMRAWRQLRQEEVRMGPLSAQSWLPVARYELFAACRPGELAYEVPFEKGEHQGALTYGLLGTLRQNGLEQSCYAIQTRLVASVHGWLKNQTPMFIGDGDRLFLGEAWRRPPGPEGPLLLRVAEGGRVLLGWGQTLRARARSRLILKGPSKQRSMLEVRQIGSTESVAQVVDGPKPSTIPPGSYVEVLPLQVVVRLLPPELADRDAEPALEKLREAFSSYRGGFVELDDEAGMPDLFVAFTGGSYEIRDPDGSTFPKLAPVLAGRGAAYEVLRRLDHLVRFRSLREIENPEAPDWLQIGLELCSDDPSVAPVPFPSGGLDLKCDEAAILRIVNRSSLRLDFVVLDLAPDYSVTQLLPPRKSFSLLPLDPNEGHVIRVRAWLPAELQEGVDILKVFATRGAVSYRWLSLPPLGQPAPERTMRGGGTPSEFPEEEWTSIRVEIRIRR